MDMSQSAMHFNGGQPRPGLNIKPTSFAGGHTTHTIESSPDQIGPKRLQNRLTPCPGVPGGGPFPKFATASGTPVQSRMVPGSEVPSGNSFPKLVAANGTCHNGYQTVVVPLELDQDPWTAPVSVCHACGSAIK
jgi:hypothetical protein